MKKLYTVALATMLSLTQVAPASAEKLGMSTVVVSGICQVDGNVWIEPGFVEASASARGYEYAGNGCDGLGITIYWQDRSSGRSRTYRASNFDTTIRRTGTAKGKLRCNSLCNGRTLGSLSHVIQL